MSKEEILQKLRDLGQKSFENNDYVNQANDLAGKIRNDEIKLDKSVITKCKALIALVHDYYTKEYTDISLASVLLAIGGIVYVVTPMDVLPDAIPGVGLMDDAMVVGIVFTAIDTEISKYMEWRRDNKSKAQDAEYKNVITDAELQEYLTRTCGDDEDKQSKELHRLSEMYWGNDVTDVRERAKLVLTDIGGI